VTCTRVSIYCLPNIRHVWVVAFEPHPWGCGALRVKESSALLMFERVPSVYELAFLKDCKTYMCFTFADEERLIDYEDGQHEAAAELREMIRLRRKEVDAILAKSKRKQSDKERRERKRTRIPLPIVKL
jgi:hypothetical protein